MPSCPNAIALLQPAGPFQSHCEERSDAAISGEVGWFRLYEPCFRRVIAIRQRRTRNDKSDFEKALYNQVAEFRAGDLCVTMVRLQKS